MQTGFDIGVVQDFLGLFLVGPQEGRRRGARGYEVRVGHAVLRTTFDVQAAYYALVSAQQVLEMRADRCSTRATPPRRWRRPSTPQATSATSIWSINGRSTNSSGRTRTKCRGRRRRARGADAPSRPLGRRRCFSRSFPAARPAGQRPDHRAPGGGRDRPPPGPCLGASKTLALLHAAAMARDFRFIGSPGVGVTFERSPERYSAVTPNASLQLPIFDRNEAGDRAAGGPGPAGPGTRAGACRRHSLRGPGRRRAPDRDAQRRERYSTVVLPLREELVRLSQEQY